MICVRFGLAFEAYGLVWFEGAAQFFCFESAAQLGLTCLAQLCWVWFGGAAQFSFIMKV